MGISQLFILGLLSIKLKLTVQDLFFLIIVVSSEEVYELLLGRLLLEVLAEEVIDHGRDLWLRIYWIPAFIDLTVVIETFLLSL